MFIIALSIIIIIDMTLFFSDITQEIFSSYLPDYFLQLPFEYCSVIIEYFFA